MRSVTTVVELRAVLRARRAAGDRIALVPTMGALHDGHLALVDEARHRSDCVVMSIFVNPLQFGAGEDLSRYPRDPDGDARKAAARGVDVLFTPTADEMYPGPRVVSVVPGRMADRWEGAVRPGHFVGVLTVVAKLLHMVAPDVAVFGQKDVQQATLVRAMVRDLDFDLDVVIAPTTRDADGLALSSRNAFLSADDRRDALVLQATLRAIADGWRGGTRDAAALLRVAERSLIARPAVAVDYVALVDPATLEPVGVASAGTVAMIAARVGSTRLIDNIVLGAAAR